MQALIAWIYHCIPFSCRHLLKATILLLPLLGFTWIIGLFAVGEEGRVFAYLFVIANVFQVRGLSIAASLSLDSWSERDLQRDLQSLNLHSILQSCRGCSYSFFMLWDMRECGGRSRAGFQSWRTLGLVILYSFIRAEVFRSTRLSTGVNFSESAYNWRMVWSLECNYNYYIHITFRRMKVMWWH